MPAFLRTMALHERIQLVKKLGLPSDQFVVACSGVLEKHGIREAHDLDILVSKKLFRNLIKEYTIKRYAGCNCIGIDIGNDIEIFDDSLFLEKNIATEKELLESADYADGVQYMKMYYVMKLKKVLGREKDIHDLMLIKKYQHAMEEVYSLTEQLMQSAPQYLRN